MQVASVPAFPEHLDDTMLSAFRTCPLYWYYGYLRNLRPLGDTAIDLVAGGAYATGLEVARKHFWNPDCDLSYSEVIADAQRAAILKWGPGDMFLEHNKSLPNVLCAIEAYFTHWGVATDPLQPLMHHKEGKEGLVPAIEFSFALPIGVTHPVTGQPILYTGKLDFIAARTGGVWLVDDKTTSGFGPQWFKSWDMRSQFSGYSWAARESGIQAVGTAVRGCAFLANRNEFAEAFTFRPDWRIEEWLQDTRETIQRMIYHWQQASFPQAQGQACNAYNRPCRYSLLCTSRNPEDWVSANYKIHVWNPLTDEV
jgi:hypothetical protein